MERTCIIVAAGEYGGEKIARRDGDMLIAADAGYLLCQRLGLAPDQVVGDFDSMGFVPDRSNVTRLPVEKDDTDTLRALRIGASMGYRRFEIHAGTGGRVDHTIANIQCLIWLAERDLRGWLIDKSAAMTVIRDASIALPPRDRGTVSVFAVGGPCDGVTIKGLKYQIESARLEPGFPLGVSNEYVGAAASIGAAHGTLLICLPRDLVCE